MPGTRQKPGVLGGRLKLGLFNRFLGQPSHGLLAGRWRVEKPKDCRADNKYCADDFALAGSYQSARCKYPCITGPIPTTDPSARKTYCDALMHLPSHLALAFGFAFATFPSRFSNRSLSSSHSSWRAASMKRSRCDNSRFSGLFRGIALSIRAMSYGYIAYIDESGDDGLRSNLRPDAPQGASEWMVITAVVVRVDTVDSRTVEWTREIIRDLGQHQTTHLHFHKLKEDKKRQVCRAIAALPLRCFVVLSHKRNMLHHRNLRAERATVNRTAWFFCWLSRLLLERVTAYCHQRTFRDYGECRKIRVEFSERGGVKIDDVKNYYRYLSGQNDLGMMHLNNFNLAWPVVDTEQMFIYPNRMRAGLQLADCVSSSFFQAVERTPAGIVRPESAKLLLNSVCSRANRRYGFGLKVMPTWIPSRLPENQCEIIDFYRNA